MPREFTLKYVKEEKKYLLEIMGENKVVDGVVTLFDRSEVNGLNSCITSFLEKEGQSKPAPEKFEPLDSGVQGAQFEEPEVTEDTPKKKNGKK